MKTEQHDLLTIISDLEGLKAQIGLIQNYVDCVQQQAEKTETDDDRVLVIASLTNDGGFCHMFDVLDHIHQEITKSTNKLSEITIENKLI